MPTPDRKTKRVPLIQRRRRLTRQNGVIAGLPDDLAMLEPLALIDVASSSPHLVRWEIEATTSSGPYTLSTCFPSGRLVQIFDRASAALARQAEIQEMLVLHAQRAFLTNRRYADGRRHL
jgi:hypothetical protein